MGWGDIAARRGPDGSPPGPCADLVGRERKRRLFVELVDSLGSSGGAAVLIGEPGIGETALLADIASADRGI